MRKYGISFELLPTIFRLLLFRLASRIREGHFVLPNSHEVLHQQANTRYAYPAA